jgi:murein tripeptide amidase MpaA
MLNMEKFLFLLLIIIFTTATFAKEEQEKIYKVRLGASTKEQRSLIANLMPIDRINTDSVESLINASDLKTIQKQIPYMLLQASEVSSSSSWFDFPSTHAEYHNYESTLKKLDFLSELHPLIAQKIEIGLSHENRSIRGLRISASNKDDTPAFLLMGLHHAREHLSVEVSLLFAEYLVNNYSSDDRVRELLTNRVVYIIPIINPDGENYDLKDKLLGK